MRIVADQQEIFNDTLIVGEAREFAAEKYFLVHLGNAGSVEVFKNDQSLGYLGELGQVVKQEFYK
jgi:metal-dependent hydrolase (beta-lactamase superfamily II)